jgi:Protein of unknown function (DUF4231)
VKEQDGQSMVEPTDLANSPELAKADSGAITHVLRQRIEDRYKGDDAWYLVNRFLPEVENYGRLESHNGSRYHSLQWALILISPLTAFLVGVEVLTTNVWASFLKGAALLAALVVTALTAALHAFNYLTKSVQYRNVRESLVAEFIAMDCGIGEYSGLAVDEKLPKFKSKIEFIVQSVNANWATLQTPPQAGGASG